MTSYGILFAIVFGVNLMPAFGPPTWSIIALYTLDTDRPLSLLVVTGALAAASGRFLLAHATRLVGARMLPERTRGNLAAARAALERRRRHTIFAIGLFALSPVPSAQLFEAAGLTRVRLLGFTTAFFAGRLVSYSIYGYTAKGIRASSIGDTLRQGLTSPLNIALQIGMIALLVALTQVDWRRRLHVDHTSGDGNDRRKAVRAKDSRRL